MRPRIVLAYSGALRTSVAVQWLSDTYDADVVAVTLDLGQGGELEEIRSRALAAGAIRAHVLDARDEFARTFLWRALQAGAIGHWGHGLATALARPLIVQKLLDVAEMEQSTVIAHGAVSGDDHRRFERAAGALRPDVEVLAPAQIWRMSVEEEREYARVRHLPGPVSSRLLDANLWTRAAHGSEPPAPTRGTSARLEIEFERGVPIAVNGVSMGLVELIESLTTIAGGEGVGRIPLAQDASAPDSPTACDAPAAVVLDTAHRELEVRVTSPDVAEVKRALAATYAELVRAGLWFSPLREAIDAFTAKLQENMTGVVGLSLVKGRCAVTTSQQPSFAAHS